MPLFMYGLPNFSEKHGQEIMWIKAPGDLEEFLEVAGFNRAVLEGEVKRVLQKLWPARPLDKLPPCIEKIVEAPSEWGQKLSGLEGYRHSIYISLCWALGACKDRSAEEAKRIALEFARGLRYDETHTSTADYQFEYCYRRPFPIDCDVLEAAGLCDEKCPKKAIL